MTDPLRELLRECRDILAKDWCADGHMVERIDAALAQPQIIETLNAKGEVDGGYFAQPRGAKPVAWMRVVPRTGRREVIPEDFISLHEKRNEGWMPLYAAPQPPAGKGTEQLSCGHPASLMRKSAETGEDLFCELCDCRSARSDAEAMEAKYRADRDAFQALLQEGADGFGRVLIATRDWTKRVRAALKGKPTLADASREG